VTRYASLYTLLKIISGIDNLDQIAQDDDGFDLASRDSLDLGSDLESGTPKPPAYDSLPASGGASRGAAGNSRDVSPLPAPIPQKPANLPRASLEGDTMFALEDERFSEDDSEDEGEGKRFMGSHK